jgi:hypothetical protein
MLARLLHRFPAGHHADAIAALFDKQFVPDKIAGECAYLLAPTARGFERPYGWAWLLKLAAELQHHQDASWSRNLAPLAELFVQRFHTFLPLATYPIRVGTHFNTAFALRMAADYADATGDAGLHTLLYDKAQSWYGGDGDCPAWGEPSGDEFLSPTLIEAECMRRLLPRAAFLVWLRRFLPRIAQGEPATLFKPPTVSDRTDGKIAHLDGLSLSRAWCWRALAAALREAAPGEGHDAHALAQAAADRHLAAALPHIAGDYMGEHWLASFAVLALDESNHVNSG